MLKNLVRACDLLCEIMAEFENFRKRTEKEKATMFEMGAKSVIEKILPVADNFERGLAQAAEGDALIIAIISSMISRALIRPRTI